MDQSRNPKVILVGLDGATWDLIEPWVKEGKLPTFKKLMEEGAWAVLDSTMPPVTAPAWASLLTGKNPNKTGIYDFFYLKRKVPPLITPCSGSMIQHDSLLTILSNNGIKIASLNIPMTYPPYKVNGQLVSGIESPPGKKFAYPSDLYAKLKSKGYTPEPVISYVPGKEKEYIESLNSTIEKRNALLFEILDCREFDILLFFFRETDLVSHTFWKFMDRNHPLNPKKNNYRDEILNTYKKADKSLRQILNKTKKDDVLFVISDHGFGSEYYRVNLNLWLIENGYIKIKSKIRTTARRLLNKIAPPSKIWNTVNRLGFKFFMEVKARETTMGKTHLSSKIFLTFDDVNWDQTKAFSFGCIGRHLPIFLQDRFKSKSLLDELKSDIKKLNDFLGERVVKRIAEGQGLPDLFVEFEEPYAGYTIPPPYISEGGSVVSNSPATQSGAHKINGILMAYGKDIEKKKLQKQNIVDIAPTILHIFGIPVPTDMDGKVMKKMFKENSKIKKRRVKYEQKSERRAVKRIVRRLKKERKI